MSLGSRIVAKLFKLTPAETYDVAVEEDIEVPMPDGVVLLANRYYARGKEDQPLILIRTPYGRAGQAGLFNGRIFAERGFQVLIQSCRGTYGSGGTLNPFHQEQADGLATVTWLKTQPWFKGKFATLGASYEGFNQWAIARHADPAPSAMMTRVSSAEFRTPTYPSEGLWLESALGWTNLVSKQEGSRWALIMSMMGPNSPLNKAVMHLPLNEADKVGVGETVDFWQDWVNHDQLGDPWWDTADFAADVPHIQVPNYMVGGWYDIFLPHTLRDFENLKAGGQQPQLTIGPWVHTQVFKMSTFNFAEIIGWFKAHLYGDKSALRKLPVRIFVMGAEEWRDLPDFPPQNVVSERWYLGENGRLSTTLPAQSAPDEYRYDPSDPTPNFGGAGMGRVVGPKDNRKLEARDDVLVYTSEVLKRPLEAIGPVQAELYVKSSLEHTDFFVRLCDVDPSGKSTNICDNLIRLWPGRVQPEADGTLKLAIDLWPTAYQFKAGHQIRVQVSSGAFPRWSRNLGSGEPLATGTTLKAAEQMVYHDPAHLSAIILPLAPLA